MTDENSTLSAGKYKIELSKGATHIYTEDESGAKEWVAATTDPNKAMEIVEGLLMVEMKRFYHPESQPQISIENVNKKPEPPFLGN